MAIPQYNEEHLPGLEAELRTGRVAALVGAGASMACGYPGWGSFLDVLADELRKLDKLKDDYLARIVGQPSLLIRADQLIDELGDGFLPIFKETFEPSDDLADAAPGWVRLLIDLDLPLLLTTNYTTELEAAAFLTPLEPVLWHEFEKLDAALRKIGGKSRVVYLHGRWDSSPLVSQRGDYRGSDVILGETSYQYAYEHPGILAEKLGAVGQSHTLLVVGASLGDEDITGVLRAVNAQAGDGAAPHYVILGLRPGEEPAAAAVEPLERFGLRALFYPVNVDDGVEDHSALDDLLSRLVGTPERALEDAVATADRELVEQAPGEYPPAPRIVHPLPAAAHFQPRPAYEVPIRLFIERDCGGVLGLVGVGGSGKTALVRASLSHALQSMDGVLVWSFNQEPDAGGFLRAAASYARGAEVPDDWGEAKAFLEFKTKCPKDASWLLVLDGLESIQTSQPDDDVVHGSIESNVLHQFLLWLAQGTATARALITTRFSTPSLAAEKGSDRVELLELDYLTRPQARGLLQARGVAGSDEQLNDVLDHYGTHALTVDHLGGVITHYLDGNPDRYRELGDGPLTRFVAGDSGAKLLRVVRAYEGYLAADEPEVRDTLARVVVFPRPVTALRLASIFLEPEHAEHAGSLAGKSPLDLTGYLNRLCELQFLRRERTSRNEVVYGINPAFRDAVWSALGETDRIGYAQAAQDTMLENAPGMRPTEPEALDFLEDLIDLCITTGNLEQAFDLYWVRLGSYGHLGKQLGDYERGARVARRLVDATSRRADFSRRRHNLLVTDLALSLTDTGRLADSLRYLRQNCEPDRWAGEPREVSIANGNFAEALVFAGSLPEAEIFALAAHEAAEDAEELDLKQNAALELARATGLRGDLARSFEQFAACLRYQNTVDGASYVLYSSRGVALCLLLLRRRRISDAWRIGVAGQKIHALAGWPNRIAQSQLILAEAHRQGREYEQAADLLGHALTFAYESNHQETLLESQLVGARLKHDQSDAAAAIEQAESGLRGAQAGGWHIAEIDLRNALATIQLDEDPESALRQATKALELSADPECDFFWGRLDAHKALAAIHGRLGNRELAVEHQRQAAAHEVRAEITDEMVAPLLPVDEE